MLDDADGGEECLPLLRDGKGGGRAGERRVGEGITRNVIISAVCVHACMH